MNRQDYLDEAAREHARAQSTTQSDWSTQHELRAIYSVLRAIAERDTVVMGVDVKSSGEMGKAAVAAMVDGFGLSKPEKSSRDYLQAIADAMNAADDSGNFIDVSGLNGIHLTQRFGNIDHDGDEWVVIGA